jgi:putative FmdB family regulatory protein
MAIYPYKCEFCGKTEEVHQRISDYSKAPIVPPCCDGLMVRVITAPMVVPDYQPFQSHIDGTIINSRSAQREYMARNGLVVYDDALASNVVTKKQEIAKQAVADIKQDLVESLHKVDAGYKPQLETIDD